MMSLSGPIDVHKDEIHFIRKYDAEPMIRYGWLSHVSSS